MTDPSVRIRPYHERDRSDAMSLANGLEIGVAPWRDQAAVRSAVTGWIDRSLNESTAPGHAVYIALIAEEVVGLITVGTREHFTGEVNAYVGELIVAESMERRGIGTRLMQAAESWATEHGLMRVALETGAANAGARAFYASLGCDEEDVRLTRSSAANPHHHERSQLRSSVAIPAHMPAPSVPPRPSIYALDWAPGPP